MASPIRAMAFSDGHGSIPRGLGVARRAREGGARLLVCAGDFSAMGAVWEEGIAPLALAERPMLCVSGNHEPPGLMARVVETFPWVSDLDGRALALDDVVFAGFGAAGLDREGWDPEARLEALARLVEGVERLVLVSHLPPDTKGATEKVIRRFCLERQPEVVLCGHVHRQAGREFRIGPTRVIQLGPGGTLVEI